MRAGLALLVAAALLGGARPAAAQVPEPGHEVRAREVLRDDRFDPPPDPLRDFLAGPRAPEEPLTLRRGATDASASGLSGVLRPSADGGYDYRERGFQAHIAPDGQVSITPRPAFDISAGWPTFDVTDFALRRAGEEPYARQHTRFMRATAELRRELRERSDGRSHAAALGRLRARLELIWRDTRRAVGARRAALFELWDECNDTPVGARARNEVERFVQRQLPPGSAAGFSIEELERLNAGRVRAEPFDPYGANTSASAGPEALDPPGPASSGSGPSRRPKSTSPASRQPPSQSPR